MPGGLHPHAHADSSLLQIAIESFRFSITVVQSPIAALTSFLIQKRDLLKARVIIYAYNQHVWLLSPEPLVVDKPQSTRVEGSQHCYEIKCSPSTLPVRDDFRDNSNGIRYHALDSRREFAAPAEPQNPAGNLQLACFHLECLALLHRQVKIGSHQRLTDLF